MPGVRFRAAKAISGLLGFQLPDPSTAAPGSASLEDMLARVQGLIGNQFSPLPTTQTRWHLSDLETAIHHADVGDLRKAGQLYRAMMSDGVLAGVTGTRDGGVVRLPKKFWGPEEMVARLKGTPEIPGVFDIRFPSSELTLLARDGDTLGVGVARFVHVDGLPFKVLHRLDPEWLSYRWSEDRWYYNSIVGPLPITPGDGTWVLHTPGGRVCPWQHGLWKAEGRAYIAKEHAFFLRENYSGKLANSARAAVAPAGATEEQTLGWFQKVMAWGVNTVFALKPGYDVKLIESNGRGFQVFQETIKTCNEEIIIAVAGQLPSTTGGEGFDNADVHKSISMDRIDDTATGLEFTINTQGIPAWVNDEYGADALSECARVEWDTAPPKDLRATADALQVAGQAIVSLNAAFQPYGVRVNSREMSIRFGVPVEALPLSPPAPEPLQEAA